MSRPPTTPAAPDQERAQRFTSVATQVWEPLQRYLRRRAHPDDVDDVAAETLTVMWRRLDDIPAGFELPWCYSVARRCLANHRRSAHRRARLGARLQQRGSVVVTSADDPAVLVERSDPSLRSALEALSADDRELVLLWAWEQLSVAELAVALGVNPNTVSARLRRARQRLAQLLMSTGPVAGHVGGGVGHTGGGRTQETSR